MTLAPEQKPEAPPVPEGHVRLTIDGTEVDAPKGELLIRTCERLGIIVPRFCDHPLLALPAAEHHQRRRRGVEQHRRRVAGHRADLTGRRLCHGRRHRRLGGCDGRRRVAGIGSAGRHVASRNENHATINDVTCMFDTCLQRVASGRAKWTAIEQQV